MRLFYVNDTLVDLADNQVIALTKQSNNLSDFNSKRSNLSNELSLPKSDINNLVFGNANDLSSTAIQRNWYTVKYIQEYEEIISYGRGKLVSAAGNFYKFIVYWGNIDLVAILGDKTLRDLSLSDLDHLWNLTNVSRASFTTHPTISGRDINYPILNTHETEELRSGADSSNYLFASRLVPFISLSRILKQIGIDNGLTFEGINEFTQPADPNSINEHIRNDYWIPVSDRQPTFNFEQEPILNSQRNFIDSIVGATSVTDLPKVLNYIDADGIITTQYEFINAGIYNLSFSIKQHFKSYKNNSLGVGVFSFVYLQFSTDGGSTWSQTYANAIDAYIDYLNGTLINTAGINTNILDAEYENNLYEFDVDNEIALTHNATAGSLVRVATGIILTHSGGGSATVLNAYHNIGSSIEITKDLIQFGDTYPVGINLPEIKQIDVLKFVAAITCSLVDVEDGTNVVRFTRFRDIVNGITQAQDYSDKVESVEITSYQPPLAQNNYLNYSHDDDTNETTGQGNLTIVNNTLPLTAELYRAPFAASKNESWDYAGAYACQIARYPIIKVWNEAFNDLTGRIFRLKPMGYPIYIGTSTDPTNTASAKYIAYFAAGQSFGDGGYLGNYSDYQNTMQDYKGCKAVCKLSSSDFKAIDLYKSMYVEHFGAYFLIKIVPDFVEGKKVTVELIKL